MPTLDLKTLLNNGLFYTRHAQTEMADENITTSEIKETLENGTPKPDNSTRNDKTFAWNHKLHFTVTYNDLTVVVCESVESAILVVSVYHGFPHIFSSNPYNKVK